jgi:hypothetical protein
MKYQSWTMRVLALGLAGQSDSRFAQLQLFFLRYGCRSVVLPIPLRYLRSSARSRLQIIEARADWREMYVVLKACRFLDITGWTGILKTCRIDLSSGRTVGAFMVSALAHWSLHAQTLARCGVCVRRGQCPNVKIPLNWKESACCLKWNWLRER